MKLLVSFCDPAGLFEGRPFSELISVHQGNVTTFAFIDAFSVVMARGDVDQAVLVTTEKDLSCALVIEGSIVLIFIEPVVEAQVVNIEKAMVMIINENR